jgi:hypothetical protein
MPHQIKILLWLYGLWLSSEILHSNARPNSNQALRLCFGTYRTTPVESLQVEANDPSLTLRRNKLALQYAVKLQSNPNSPAFDCTYNPKYRFVFQRKMAAIPPFGLRCENLLHNMDIDLDSIAVLPLPLNPPWTLHSGTVNFHLHCGKKSSIDPDTFKL